LYRYYPASVIQKLRMVRRTRRNDRGLRQSLFGYSLRHRVDRSEKEQRTWAEETEAAARGPARAAEEGPVDVTMGPVDVAMDPEEGEGSTGKNAGRIGERSASRSASRSGSNASKSGRSAGRIAEGVRANI
jgi:hypothetical protein